MPEIPFMGEVQVDIPDVDMGKPKQSESKLCESCRNHLDTASAPCTCTNSPEELEHSTSIRENKENLKIEKCPDKMVGCARTKVDDADDMETEILQKAESNLKAAGTQEPIISVLPPQQDQPKEQVVNVELLQTGYKKLADENRQLREKVERLKKKKESPEDDLTDNKTVVIPLTKRRGRMAEEDRMKIIRKMPYLIKELNPKHLISTIFSKQIITEDEADELRATLKHEGRFTCAEDMLYLLLRCGPYAYKVFLKCLESTGYSRVIQELEPNCAIYEGTFKYPGHKYLELIDDKNPKRQEFIQMIETDVEKLDPGIEFVVVITLESGCVQVTYHLISVGSKSENELREILEQNVKSGYIGNNKVSTDGFSFKKIAGGNDEDTDIDIHGEDQDLQNVKKLKRKVECLEEDNSRLRKQISELENKSKILKRDLEKGLPYVEPTAFKDEFPLHHAALYTTDKEEFESVLDKHASTIRQLDKDGDTPFDKACLSQYCPLDKVKLIVNKGYRDAETLVQICQTAPKSLLSLICCIPMKNKLDESVIRAMTELRKQLMDGDDIDARTHSDKTLLHFASEYCDIEAMTFLIDHDSDVRSIDTDGASPMVYSCKSHDDPVQKINLLEAHFATIDQNPIYNITLLHTACEFGTLATVKFLTDPEGLDVNGLDSYGKSPLYYSCKSDTQPIEKIKFLIKMGASLKCSAIDNYTLLHAACDYNTVEVVEHLIELGLDVESEDIYRYTPLHCCCRSKIDPIDKIKKLADHGARFLIKFRREYIGIASKFDLTETVEFLKRSLPENVVPEVSNEGEVAMDVPVHAEQT